MRQYAQPRSIVTALLAVLVLFLALWPIQANAAEPTYTGSIELTGEYTGTFTLKSSAMDLFKLEDIVPGQSWQGKVEVKNTASRDMEICILSIVNDLQDNDVLYDKLDLKIFREEEEIYSGSYGATTENISKFYTVRPNETIDFDITVTFPADAGNEYQGQKMDSTWTFEARYANGGGYYPYYPTPDVPDKKPVIQTGHELTDTNTVSAGWIFLFILCITGIIVTAYRVNAELLRKREAEYSQIEEGNKDE